jgi:processive 1,2-diacylglycerol beta-glucosyltransferase
MIELYNNQNNVLIGEITETQLEFLVNNMEEESMEDQDYAITAMTLAYFEELNADPALLSMLRQALGDRDELMIRWERD